MSKHEEESVRARRLLALLLAGIAGSACLLLLPPGPSTRIQWMVRYVFQPVQAWSDCAVRVSRAAVGGDLPEDEAATLESLRCELAAARLEVRTANAGLDSAAVSARRLSADLGAFRRRYTFAVGRVIRRDPLQEYYDCMTLDIGTRDGVKAGQYAVSVPSGGEGEQPRLVGIVRSVSVSSSVVDLVSHADVAIPCSVPKRGVDAVLMGVAPTESDGASWEPAVSRQGSRLYLAHSLGKVQETVEPGDEVFTSGHGGNPYGMAGVYVGKVTDSRLTEEGRPQVELEAAARLANLSHVLVILGRERLP